MKLKHEACLALTFRSRLQIKIDAEDYSRKKNNKKITKKIEETLSCKGTK
jgi:hypothetical protein